MAEKKSQNTKLPVPSPTTDGNGKSLPEPPTPPTKPEKRSKTGPPKTPNTSTIRRKLRRKPRITQFAPVNTDCDPHEEPSSLAGQFRRNRNPLSSVMASTIFHSLVLIALALSTYLWPDKSLSGISIDALLVDQPEIEKPNDSNQTVQVELPVEIKESPIELDEDSIASDIEETTPMLTENDDLASSENVTPNPVEPVAVAESGNLPTGGGLAGRNQEARAKRASEKGGSQASEDAVELGLKWLAAHQRIDGSWRLKLEDTPCKGQCQHSGTRESTSAATGLALLAFLGAGYTHETGPYQDEVRRGIDYLRSRVRINKYGGSLAEPTMYAHAIATMALGEAFAMTKDSSLQSTLESLMEYTIAAQANDGGWRYTPQAPGDMTVTGWQIMALKSCELGGLKVPDEVWTKVDAFLDSKQANYGATYGYIKPGEDPTPTAIGLLARMYSGWKRAGIPLLEGAQRISELGPSKTDIYFDYYGTLVMHHLRDERWEEWNEEMRDYLIETQDRRGHQTGSWHFPDKHGSVGGRLYTTAMAIMILEVYYRYLPLYEEKAVDRR